MKETNREYKDRLFKFIFGNPEKKAWTLSLYNAINGSHYTNPDDIRFNTIEDAVYMSMRNDVSFLVADIMSFYEQQSSFNPNMPMRFLIYAGMAYAKYIQQSNSYKAYSSALQKAPVPRCVCFYNGSREQEDKVILHLKDAFDEEGDIDVRVTMLNINYGKNKELMEACQPLREYAFFVDRVKTYQNELNDLGQAVDAALKDLPKDSLIKPFLESNQAEVKYMCITEYDEEKVMNQFREEGRAEGREEGREEGELKLASLMVKLKELGRIEDAFKAASDPILRAKLYQELSIA